MARRDYPDGCQRNLDYEENVICLIVDVRNRRKLALTLPSYCAYT